MNYDLKTMTASQKREFFIEAMQTWHRLAEDTEDSDLHARRMAHAKHCKDIADSLKDMP